PNAKTEGKLSLNASAISDAGLSLVGAAQGASITVRGTLANLNAFFDGEDVLTYTPGEDYNGSDALKVTINDLGNIGQGGAKKAEQNYDITINPINDAPEIDDLEFSADEDHYVPVVLEAL